MRLRLLAMLRQRTDKLPHTEMRKRELHGDSGWNSLELRQEFSIPCCFLHLGRPLSVFLRVRSEKRSIQDSVASSRCSLHCELSGALAVDALLQASEGYHTDTFLSLVACWLFVRVKRTGSSLFGLYSLNISSLWNPGPLIL